MHELLGRHAPVSGFVVGQPVVLGDPDDVLGDPDDVSPLLVEMEPAPPTPPTRGGWSWLHAANERIVAAKIVIEVVKDALGIHRW
ncbi:Hypothetical protein A7982_00587 [Minicystis rosea]|nr:Hypothetical protein A7982_00587 [Minicystis rosea]